ncbi:MAG: hypothetical protein RIT27_236 [Pseudomonadota bacterium]|jgi:hypothetical protein
MQLVKPAILMFLVLFSIQIPAVETEEWYVILGSFPLNEKGLKSAQNLREKFRTDNINQDDIIVAESNFYTGITKELYVVMAGAFPNQKDAKQWIVQKNIKQIVPDVYVKKAKESF